MAIKKNNKECLLCHRPYRYCGSCQEYKMLPKWMSMFDKDNCHEIFNIVSGFNQGTTSPEDARERILNQDLSEMGLYAQNVQDAIDKILGATDPVVVPEVQSEAIYIKEETHSEEAPEEEILEDSTLAEETVFVRSPKKRYKKNKNVEQ